MGLFYLPYWAGPLGTMNLLLSKRSPLLCTSQVRLINCQLLSGVRCTLATRTMEHLPVLGTLPFPLLFISQAYSPLKESLPSYPVSSPTGTEGNRRWPWPQGAGGAWVDTALSLPPTSSLPCRLQGRRESIPKALISNGCSRCPECTSLFHLK